ncbi:hypothetical protein CC79DRAFT_1369644 [Sarocladium strictum]
MNDERDALDMTARVFQFVLATIAVGTNGAILSHYGLSSQLVFTEALAVVAMFTSVIRLFSPMRLNLMTFLYDLLQTVGWAIAAAFVADELREVKGCGFSYYYYYHYPQGGKCGLLKSTVICAALSVPAWFVPFVLGAWWSYFKLDKVFRSFLGRGRD